MGIPLKRIPSHDLSLWMSKQEPLMSKELESQMLMVKQDLRHLLCSCCGLESEDEQQPDETKSFLGQDSISRFPEMICEQ